MSRSSYAILSTVTGVLLLFVASCSSGGGGGGGGGGGATPPVNVPTTTSSVSGVATKGVFFSGGEIVGKNFPFGRELFRTEIGDDGSFEALSFSSPSGQGVVLEASGTFVSESTLQQETTGDFPLSAVFFPRADETSTVNITAVSTLIHERVRYLCLDRPNLTLEEKIELAKAEYGLLFSIDDPDVVPEPTEGDALKSWFLGAAFTEVAAGKGLPSTEVICRTAEAWRDGEIDAGDGQGALAFFPPPPVTAAELSAAFTSFLANPNNPGIPPDSADIADLGLAFQQFLNTFTDGPVICALNPRFGPAEGGDEITVFGDDLEGRLAELEALFEDSTAERFSLPLRAATGGNVSFDIPSLSPGPGRIRVMDGAGRFDAQKFCVTGQGAITIDTVTPTSGPTQGGTLVRIKGHGFDNTTGVSFGGTLAEVLGRSPTRIDAVTPPAPGGNGVSVPIRIGNVAGGDYNFRESPTFDSSAPAGPLSLFTIQINSDSVRADIRQLGLNSDGSGTATGTEFTMGDGEVTRGPSQVNLRWERNVFGVGHASVGRTDYDLEGAGLASIPDALPDFKVGTANDAPNLVEGVAVQLRVESGTVPRSDYHAAGFLYQLRNGGGLAPTPFSGKVSFEQTDSAGGTTAMSLEDLAQEKQLFLNPTVRFNADGTIFVPDVDFDGDKVSLEGHFTPDGSAGVLVGSGAESLFYAVLGAAVFGELSNGNYIGRGLGHGRDGFALTELDATLAPSPGGSHGLFIDQGISFGPGGPSLLQERLSFYDFLVVGPGIVWDLGGRRRGFVAEGGMFMQLSAAEDRGLPSGVSYHVPSLTNLTNFSYRGNNFNVVGQGTEVKPGSFQADPDPFLQTDYGLGRASPGEPGANVNGGTSDFPLATPFSFETLLRKTLTRDSDGGVSTAFGDQATDEGFAFTVINNNVVAFPIPIPQGGTGSFMTGFIGPDNRVGLLRGSSALDVCCTAQLLKQPGSVPNVDGDYLLQRTAVQMENDGAVSTVNVRGAVVFNATGATFDTEVIETSIAEDFTTNVTPIQISGNTEVFDDGFIRLRHQTNNGLQLIPGFVSPDGQIAFLMDLTDEARNAVCSLTKDNPGLVIGERQGITMGQKLIFGGDGGLLLSVSVGTLNFLPNARAELTRMEIIKANFLEGTLRDPGSLLDAQIKDQVGGSFLMDIPAVAPAIFGRLFWGTMDEKGSGSLQEEGTGNLLIFLTPRIVRDETDEGN